MCIRDRYYGLLELGEIGGIWKNVAGRYEINGKKIYAKQIYAEPETYFDEYVMQALDEIAQREFSYLFKDNFFRSLFKIVRLNKRYDLSRELFIIN